MRRFVWLAFFVALTTPVHAQDFAKGKVAYDQGDYSAALSEWQPLAEQGNADAQFFIGIMYRTGAGVPKDSIVSIRWLERAAEQGLGSAQLYLGFAYQEGGGVEKDNVLAYHWFNLASAARRFINSDFEPYPKFQENIARQQRELLEKRQMTRSEVAEAQRHTREWLKAHRQ